MKAAPSWRDVYGGHLPDSLPPVARVDTPYVPRPTCPAHCSGRHGVDSEIRCRVCGVTAYQDWFHEWPGRAGMHWHALKPVNGAPPLYDADMPCPTCGGGFRK
jgi:hypothetical protein